MATELVCWKCGASLKGLRIPLEMLAACKACNAELRVCRMCKYYNPHVSEKCDEPKAEYPREWGRANFCDYFKSNPHTYIPRDTDKIQAAKSKLESLFDSGPLQTNTNMAHSRLDDLFGSGKKND